MPLSYGENNDEELSPPLLSDVVRARLIARINASGTGNQIQTAKRVAVQGRRTSPVSKLERRLEESTTAPVFPFQPGIGPVTMLIMQFPVLIFGWKTPVASVVAPIE